MHPSIVTEPPVERDRNRDGAAVALLVDADVTTERVYMERLGNYAASGTDMQSRIPILFKCGLLTKSIEFVISYAHLRVRIIVILRKTMMRNTDGDSLFWNIQVLMGYIRECRTHGKYDAQTMLTSYDVSYYYTRGGLMYA